MHTRNVVKWITLPLMLLLATYNTVLAQGQLMKITGRVIDAKSKQAMERASVYLDQTTKSTFTTDSGEFTLKAPAGNYTLVVSYVGYNSVAVAVSQQNNPRFKIELEPVEELLSEVVIKPGWQEYYHLFRRFFLGKTGQESIIKNPRTLSFDYSDTYVLTAEAREPLVIENHMLGYRIYYDLNGFVHSAGHTSYSGHSRFEEMVPENKKERARWKSNRIKVYYGSFTHFMRSLVNNDLAKQGFLVKRLEKANKAPSKIPVLKRWSLKDAPKSPDTLVSLRWNGRDYSPIDTTSLPESDSPFRFGAQSGYSILYPGPIALNKVVRPTSDPENYRLFFKNSLFVTYTKKKTSLDFWGNNNTGERSYITSILTMLVPETFVDIHGLLSNPNAVMNEGYWARQRVAEQLPYDFDPETEFTSR